ncbi:MAG: NAD(P)H-hydrate dehydratase [Thermodesulfovibrionales bacterium]|nr:NAD(P)H-hydrate dehydratase [Thermodesulfovibrionales bacterium]
MKVVAAEEMREIDRNTIKNYGISGTVLMERAGLAVAEKIKELFSVQPRLQYVGQGSGFSKKLRTPNSEPVKLKVIVLAGGGNNGGDGIVVARNLHEWGWNVKITLLLRANKLSPDCLLQYKIAKKSGVPVEFRDYITEKDLHSALVVDAIFGTGLSKNVTGKIAEIISFINTSYAPVISVDIPSGISSDTGQIMGEAVRADYTVTFGLPKRGHLLYPGADYTGRLFIEDIGFPEELLHSEKLKAELLEKRDISLLIPERQRYSHKGDYGHVLVIAGSRGKTGAAFMCAKACLRSGAGLVTIGVPESLLDVFQSRVTEEMTLPLPDKGDGTLSSKALEKILEFLFEKADVLAIGPGISVTDDTKKLVRELLLNSTAPAVIDADAINSLEGNKQILKKARSPLILTPHLGEMARLLQKSAHPPTPPLRGGRVRKGVKVLTSELQTKIEQDRINTAMFFAKETGTYLVLKGVPTVIAEPEGRVFINPTGNSGMASAGTGDVLTGMVSGFLGQGLNPLEASILGVYMHGLAGDIAAKSKGEHSLIASDITDAIPEAFHLLRIIS